MKSLKNEKPLHLSPSTYLQLNSYGWKKEKALYSIQLTHNRLSNPAPFSCSLSLSLSFPLLLYLKLFPPFSLLSTPLSFLPPPLSISPTQLKPNSIPITKNPKTQPRQQPSSSHLSSPFLFSFLRLISPLRPSPFFCSPRSMILSSFPHVEFSFHLIRFHLIRRSLNMNLTI